MPKLGMDYRSFEVLSSGDSMMCLDSKRIGLELWLCFGLGDSCDIKEGLPGVKV